MKDEEDEFIDEHPLAFLVFMAVCVAAALALVFGWIDIGIGGWLLLILIAGVSGIINFALGFLRALADCLR